ncbi:winged helix-turn-helix domain-containing protein [Acinetobacter johnsonii]|uniref:winged-helix domain-containing protein n=1 Tax=Acinetobacter johnsonii TaxID=40214 RepID=UPI002448672D|nr:winged-helix domain-containing protein [Acinetobacter johnsonii]MDH1276190.1 winged helix-turn-helix domain-containing protein [Acinetobacter johnsonii]
MKNKTEANQIATFERVISVLRVIQTTPVASTSELREKALPDISQRSVQRYLKNLERAGYVRRVLDAGWHKSDARYFLTEKAKQLFGAQG